MQGERESDRGEVERVRETNIGKERREVALLLLRASVEDGEAGCDMVCEHTRHKISMWGSSVA